MEVSAIEFSKTFSQVEMCRINAHTCVCIHVIKEKEMADYLVAINVDLIPTLQLHYAIQSCTSLLLGE